MGPSTRARRGPSPGLCDKGGGRRLVTRRPACPYQEEWICRDVLRMMCSLRAGGIPPEHRLEPNCSPHVKYRQASRFGPLDLGADSPRPSDRTGRRPTVERYGDRGVEPRAAVLETGRKARKG